MAQSGYTPILLYSSSTASAAPVAGNLTNSALGSELAINIADGKLFYKDSSNNVQVIAWKVAPTTAGGTGLSSYTAGDLVYYASGSTFTKLAIGASGNYLASNGSVPAWNAPGALTKVDDTNVTLTLGGSASTALLQSASLTLGWTGQLAVTRGGTGATTFTAGRVLFGNGTSAINTSANLFWDNTNGWLGIGTNAPPSKLTVDGTGSISTAAATNKGLMVLNQAGVSTSTNGGGIEFKASTFGSGYGSSIVGLDDGTLAFVFRQNSASWTESLRLFGSRGVSIGNTTDPGATNLSVTGSVGIGQTTAAGKLHVRQDQNGTTRTIIQNRNGSGTPISELTFITGAFDLSDNRYAYIQSAGGGSNYLDFGTSNAGSPVTYVRITAAGETLTGGTTDNGAYNLQCNGTGVWGAGAYVNGSDERIKEDIAPIMSGLDVVAKLNPVTYRYKLDWSNDQSTQTGFIAQELLTALEDQVYVDGVVQQGGTNGYYSVAYQNIIPILTKAIQEQQTLIEELNVRIAVFEEKFKE